MADFGIALAVGAAGSNRLTETGLSLGTPYYMSPEQATGDQAVGVATDIYALGAVLYEMLIGDPPYTGSTAQAILGKIIQGKTASATEERASVPRNVDAAIRKALEKLPADRFTGAQEFVRALGDPAFGHAEVAVAGVAVDGAAWKRVSMGLGALALVLAVGLGWSLLSTGSYTTARLPQRVSIVLPADRPMTFGWDPGRSLAISPNGRDVVYVGSDPEQPRVDLRSGSRQLLVRSMGDASVRELPGTRSAVQPFFQPDGQWVGFFTDEGELKKVPLSGGSSVTLADGINGSGWAFGAWTDDDAIVFSGSGGDEGLYRVSADGGSPQTIAVPDTAQREVRFCCPESVPGAGAILFEAQLTQLRLPRIDVLILETGERRVVVENASSPHYLSSGHILFQRDETLLVAPFDAGRLTVTGPAIPLIDDVRGDRTDGSGPVPQLAVSRNGTLAYAPAVVGTTTTLGLVSRDGQFEAFGQQFRHPVPVPRVSPDGRYVAFVPAQGENGEVRVYDVLRGTTNRLTQEGSDDTPAWHPDGQELAVSSRTADGSGIFLRELSGAERLLVSSGDGLNRRNMSWSPNGDLLAYTVQDGRQHDIWVLSIGDDTSPRPVLDGSAGEHSPRFSPDGRWLAYVSDESGRYEVYVRSYPQGERLTVWTDGGTGPVWSPGGDELFFTSAYEGEPSLMAVSVTVEGATLSLGTPTPMFALRVLGPTGTIERYGLSDNLGAGYDIFPDGQRFVMSRGPDPSVREIVLVTNFFEELRQRMGN